MSKELGIEDRRQVKDRRGNVDSRMLVAVKDFLFSHIKVVLVTTVMGTTAWVGLNYWVKSNIENTNKNTQSISILDDRMMKAEKADIVLQSANQLVVARLDGISSDIKDLKSTVEKLDTKMNDRITKMSDKTQGQFEELKKILYKPVVGRADVDLEEMMKLVKLVEKK